MAYAAVASLMQKLEWLQTSLRLSSLRKSKAREMTYSCYKKVGDLASFLREPSTSKIVYDLEIQIVEVVCGTEEEIESFVETSHGFFETSGAAAEDHTLESSLIHVLSVTQERIDSLLETTGVAERRREEEKRGRERKESERLKKFAKNAVYNLASELLSILNSFESKPEELDSFFNKAVELAVFLEPDSNKKIARDLARQIIEVVCEIEEEIKPVAFIPGSKTSGEGESHNLDSSLKDLLKVNQQKMDSLLEIVSREEEHELELEMPSKSLFCPVVSPMRIEYDVGGNKMMVGLDDQRSKLKNLFLENSSKLKDIMVKGMTCIANTSHAKESLTIRLIRIFIVLLSESTKKTHSLMEKVSRTEQQPSKSLIEETNDCERKNKKMMVGMHDQRSQVKDLIVKGSSELKSISVVGMAGIGKTTLVKQVFYDPIVQDLFSLSFIVEVGQNFQLKEFLLLVLRHMSFNLDELGKKTVDELGNCLNEALEKQRYLIVLDDIWSCDVLYKLKTIFPNGKNGSRIIQTTRILWKYSFHIDSFFTVRFLNDEESWELLHEIVFARGERCHHELEEFGKKIAQNCEGLPLAINAIGDLLLKVDKTPEEWRKVAENEDSLVIKINEDTPISKALTPSYMHLSAHLRTCFVYMGAFPKHYEITLSKLTNLWTSEGFVGPAIRLWHEASKVADSYLDNLFQESLVLVRERSALGFPKKYKVHYVFRILCVSIAEDQKFCHVIKKLPTSFPQVRNTQRRMCIHENVVLAIKQMRSWMESVYGARSLLCFGQKHQYPLPVHLGSKFLRVLDALAIRFYKFPYEVLDPVCLKYLAITYDGDVPGSISKLVNLEVLILHRHQSIRLSNGAPIYLPVEIWELQQLRHLTCTGRDLPDPSNNAASRQRNGSCEGDDFGLNKLLTLSGVSARSCIPGVLSRIPCIEKLGIWIESAHNGAETLDFSGMDYDSEVETLKCVVVNPDLRSKALSPFGIYRAIKHIRKLTLSGCGFPWEFTKSLGGLRDLRVLQLRCNSFQGPVWDQHGHPELHTFSDLEFLLLEDLDLEQWIPVSTVFHGLMKLVIRHCYKLREIPNLQSVREIVLIDCSPTAVQSARRLLEVPRHDNLEVLVHNSWEDK